MKILIVDDDSGCREMLHSHLNRRHEVSVLTNGRNALALLADDAHDFDLVLLDLNMPRLGGEKLIQVLNESDFTKTRIVIVTGLHDIEHIRKWPNVRDVLRKPFDLTAVDALIVRMLAESDCRPSLSSG